jgi:tRNA dimethylallyltransferase
MLAIVGPTGAGKSSFALRLAAQFHGEIVNYDSMQLYRGFDIGTAKTPPTRRSGIPHHMLDMLAPDQIYSAGEFARDAAQIVAQISARGHLPILAGGTGFYLRGLLEGLPDLPGRDEPLRARLLQRENRRAGSMHRLLQRLDPAAAHRIHAHDTQKLTRALEIRILTHGTAPPPQPHRLHGYTTIKLGLNPNRAALSESLDARAREMFRSGLIEEVMGLLTAGCTGDEKPFESLGYKQALQHIRGTITMEEAILSTQLATRQYAKRQGTWFRRDPEIIWLEGFGDDREVIERAAGLVRHAVLG